MFLFLYNIVWTSFLEIQWKRYIISSFANSPIFWICNIRKLKRGPCGQVLRWWPLTTDLTQLTWIDTRIHTSNVKVSRHLSKIGVFTGQFVMKDMVPSIKNGSHDIPTICWKWWYNRGFYRIFVTKCISS